MADGRLGIIGGSGLYDMPDLEDVQEVEVDTPFGRPSSTLTVGKLPGSEVVFLARHARNHSLLPSEVPYRANIYALKAAGVNRVVSVSAVGSLREEYAPLGVAVPDQLFDRTKNRPATFFGEGLVAHVGFAEPFCPALRQAVLAAAGQTGPNVHDGGVLVVMEGPQFSTIAESETYRKLGFSLIGMTALPEAKLAREAEICYATLAMVTDYDVWRTGHETVTSDMVAQNVSRNTERARQIVKLLAGALSAIGPCDCHQALRSALLTSFDEVPRETKQRLRPIIAKYIEPKGEERHV